MQRMPKPKAIDPQALAVTQLEQIIANDRLPVESRQKALETLEALRPAPPPHPEPTDPFAGCEEWPPAGHRNCVYDSHGMYRDGGAHDVTCLIDPLRRHSFPFQDARAKDGYIDLDALDKLEKELGL